MRDTSRDEKLSIANFHFWVAGILFLVCFWDIYVLKVSSWTYYYPFKAASILIFLGVGYFVKRGYLKASYGQDISFSFLYIYAYIATRYLHSTYIFAFYEGLAFFSFIYTGTLFRSVLMTLLAVSLALMSNKYIPDFTGFSNSSHLQIVTVIFGVLSFISYWFFNRQREIILKMDQKFASIGRQSAFLLHELKSPLSRFMMSNSEKDNRDADYILSIVEGVELLISKKENLVFGKFSWEEIKIYLQNEFEESCKHYHIEMKFDGFSGEGVGHRSTIKLALKNLVKNAVEAIFLENNQGTIKISRSGNLLEVSNNGSRISEEKIAQLFTPFYSGKSSRTNHGIGLHFVESVVKAHNGSIDVNVENDWNIFKLKLGEMS